MKKMISPGKNKKIRIGFVLKKCVNSYSAVTNKVCNYGYELGIPGLVCKLKYLRYTEECEEIKGVWGYNLFTMLGWCTGDMT